MSIADEQRVSASGATTTQSASQPGAYSPQVIRKLNALTSDFYAREAASFSATRQAPWHGWEKAWELITAHDVQPRAVSRDLDWGIPVPGRPSPSSTLAAATSASSASSPNTRTPLCASPPSTTAPIWHLPQSAPYLPPFRTALAAPLLLPKRKEGMLQDRARTSPKRPP